MIEVLRQKAKEEADKHPERILSIIKSRKKALLREYTDCKIKLHHIKKQERDGGYYIQHGVLMKASPALNCDCHICDPYLYDLRGRKYYDGKYKNLKIEDKPALEVRAKELKEMLG